MTIHLFAQGDRTKTIAGIIVLAATVVIAAPTQARAADSSRTAALYEGIGMGDQPSKRVRTLQRALVRRGYSVGAPGIDGRFGPLTAGAVRRFQSDWNLVVDGIVGPRTRRVLGLRTQSRARRRPDSNASRTRERRRQTNPRPAQTSPPKRDARPPASTTQDRPAARPAPSPSPSRGVEDERTIQWPLVLIAGAAVGVLIGVLWALARALSRRVDRRVTTAHERDEAPAPQHETAVVSADAPRSEMSARADEAPPTEAPIAERDDAPQIEAPAGAADDRVAPPAAVEAPDSEPPATTPVARPGRGHASPRFHVAAATGAEDSPKRAARPEATERRLIGYVTVKRFVDGDRLHSQARAIDEACERAGWQLLEIVRDTDTGRAFDRPGLRYALERIADGEAAGLIVSDLKLLSRSVVDLGTLLAWFWDAGAALIALDLGVDTSTSEGHHAASALITLSAWERERTAPGAPLQVAREHPRHHEPSDWLADRPELVERIAAMKHNHMTLRAIANQLNEEQIPTVRGGTEWRPSTVQAVLHYHRGRSWPREELPSLENRGLR